MKRTFIVLHESLSQSVLSDVFTFGMLFIGVHISQRSMTWLVISVGMFLIVLLGKFMQSDRALEFESRDKLAEWLSKQYEADGEFWNKRSTESKIKETELVNELIAVWWADGADRDHKICHLIGNYVTGDK
jgi:hypothetical protein